jgi:hypothetical protein
MTFSFTTVIDGIHSIALDPRGVLDYGTIKYVWAPRELKFHPSWSAIPIKCARDPTTDVAILLELVIHQKRIRNV